MLACAFRKLAAVFVSVKEADRATCLAIGEKAGRTRLHIKATGGNHAFFESKGVPSTKINKVLEGRPHVVDAMKNGDIQLVLNTTETRSSESDSKSIRQTAVMQKVPYYTTLPGIISAERRSPPTRRIRSRCGRCRIIFEGQ